LTLRRDEPGGVFEKVGWVVRLKLTLRRDEPGGVFEKVGWVVRLKLTLRRDEPGGVQIVWTSCDPMFGGER
jgi:hypothetical protein